MKLSRFKFILSCLGFFWLSLAAAQLPKYEETESFYSFSEVLNEDAIEWGFLSVPESWQEPELNTIKIATAVIRSYSKNDNAEALVFIQGGPGASGIQNIWSWRNHPLRKTHDIVLFDVRGTGFSEPRLCPGLGKEFLKILAKDQSAEEDQRQKTAAALVCQQRLLNVGVPLGAYTSEAVAQDLNALKTTLGYSKWNVYGVSYGTYMSQVYANRFPDDIKALVLDSSIGEISTYYTENTSNFMGSLAKVFSECKKNPECNAQYPKLEQLFYETIAQLQDKPITVEVDKSVIETESFTYNAEDFKMGIQQALYNKQLVEVIPLLITQFHERNEGALGNLVTAFSSLLSMDYGVYYSISCNETLPNNDLAGFDANATSFAGLKGGLSFYKSDFDVCEKWNSKRTDSLSPASTLSNLSSLQAPVLVLAGGYDPITPASNAIEIAKKFENGTVVLADSYGHVPGFTRIGNAVVTQFIQSPESSPDVDAFDAAAAVSYVKDIEMNAGVAKMGNSLGEMNPFFLGPLAIAVIIMLISIFVHSVRLLRKKYRNTSDKIVRTFSVITSIIGVLSVLGLTYTLLEVSNTNYFVLAFGLPESAGYLFVTALVFTVLALITLLYFAFRIKKIYDRSILFTVLFSHLLAAVYLLYWGIV